MIKCKEGIIEIGQFDGYTSCVTAINNEGVEISYVTGKPMSEEEPIQKGPFAGSKRGSQVFGWGSEAEEFVIQSLGWTPIEKGDSQP